MTDFSVEYRGFRIPEGSYSQIDGFKQGVDAVLGAEPEDVTNASVYGNAAFDTVNDDRVWLIPDDGSGMLYRDHHGSVRSAHCPEAEILDKFGFLGRTTL